MTTISAGLLMYRKGTKGWEVFLVHPGGPFWAHKDEGAWSIPKGLAQPGEDLLAAARREFTEETGFEAKGKFEFLTPLEQKSGKWIHAWAFEGDCDPDRLQSNAFRMEWPTDSGKEEEFPEVDRGEWFHLEEAGSKIGEGQQPFLEEFRERREALVLRKGG